MFAHSPDAHRRGRSAATAGCGRPRWAKLSPNVTDLVPIAAAAADAGAEAVTLVNTVMGMVIDVEPRRPLLGGGGGGLSGPAIHPVAVRAVYDVHARAARPAHRRRGRGGQRRATPSSCCWPALARCRSAPPPSPIRGPSRTCRDGVRSVVPPTTAWRPSHDLIGAAHG